MNWARIVAALLPVVIDVASTLIEKAQRTSSWAEDKARIWDETNEEKREKRIKNSSEGMGLKNKGEDR